MSSVLVTGILACLSMSGCSLDQDLFQSLSQTGDLLSVVRDELRCHQLLLAANLLSRRRHAPDSVAAQSALQLAAYSIKVRAADTSCVLY